MTRDSQEGVGVQSSCPLPANDSRESRSWPVTVFVLKPSRRPTAIEKPAASLPAATGPDTLARVSSRPSVPTGTETFPVHAVIDGRALVMLINPPRALRPKRAL